MLVSFIVLPIAVVAVLTYDHSLVEKSNFMAPLWFIALTNLCFLAAFSQAVF
jgi:hypothetical protein